MSNISRSVENEQAYADGTAEPVSRDQILRRERGQGNVIFLCPADHEQDWQPHPVDPYSAICDGHTYIHSPHTRKTHDTNWYQTINELLIL